VIGSAWKAEGSVCRFSFFFSFFFFFFFSFFFRDRLRPEIDESSLWSLALFFTLSLTPPHTHLLNNTPPSRQNHHAASHCAAEDLSTPLSLASSYVTCNRDSGASGGDGIFRATGAAISVINFSTGYGITDGAFILVSALQTTNLAYAQPLAIAAIKSNYFSTAVPNYSGGFPQVDTRLEGCTSAALGNTAALHFSRRTAARTLVSTGIQIGGISGCGGNSGGPLVDENACVVYGKRESCRRGWEQESDAFFGFASLFFSKKKLQKPKKTGVLSSTTVACSGGTNFNSWSRLSTTGGGGVNVPGLSAALVAGAVNFVS